MRRLLAPLLAPLLAVSLLLPATAASAAHLRYMPQLGNDDFAGAIELGDLPADITVSLIGATAEVSEPPTSCDGTPTGGSVWYSFTVAADGDYLVDSFTPTYFDGPPESGADLEVFEGDTLASLVEVTCDSTDSAVNYSDDGQLVGFAGTAGTTYHLRVSAEPDVTTLPLQVRRSVTPANDDFADRADASAGVDVEGTWGQSDQEASEPDPSCGSAAGTTGSLWWSFTPDVDGDWHVRSSISHSVVTTTVWTGTTLGDLVEVACDDGGGTPTGNETNGMNELVSVTAGTTYHVALATGDTEPADRSLWALQLSPAAAPANDDLADAAAIGGGLDETVLLRAADVEAGESCGATNDVWYAITAATDGLLHVDTVESDGDLELAFYTGPAGATDPADLALVDPPGCMDDDNGDSYGDLEAIEMTAGTTYYVQVMDHSDDIGLARVVITLPELPDNVEGGTPTVIDSLPYRVSTNNVDAPEVTVDSCEEYPGLQWTWTAPADMEIYVTTNRSRPDSWVGVWSGTDVTDGASQVLCNDDQGDVGHAGGTFDAVAGTTYTIEAGGLDDDSLDYAGEIQLYVTGGAGVAGEAVDQSGEALAGFCVTAEQDGEVRGTATTGETGGWAISGLDGGATTVTIGQCVTARAHVDGYESTTVDVSLSLGRTVVLDPTTVNGVPVANDDSATTAFETEVEVDVLGNDTDDGTELAITDVTQPDDGTVSCDAECTYTPDGGFSGSDTFTYAVTDGSTSSAPATVTVVVDEDGAPVPPAFSELRFDGADREATAVLVSQYSYPDPGDAEVVVLARSDIYPDALAGGPLAFAANGPILLTPPDALNGDTADEIERLGVDTVYLLGGPIALSSAVEASVEALGVDTLERLEGSDRFTTAVAVADELAAVRGGASDTAYVVEGANASPDRGWPDAVSAGPAAAVEGSPILLVTRDEVPTVTATALEALDDAIVVGGPVAVSDATFAVVDALVGSAVRVSGGTRYSTSTAVADTQLSVLTTPVNAWLATGARFPDALAAGPAVAREGSVLVLVDGTVTDGETIDWLGDNADAINGIRTLGGQLAISTGTANAAVNAVR